jgi:lipopolysaccharide export system protein LptA
MKGRGLLCILLLGGFFSLGAEQITFTADRMSGYSRENSDFTRLEGHARVSTSTIEVSADSIELTGDDFRFISALGKVKGRHIQSDMDFSCDTLRYDRTTEVASLQSNADIYDHQNEVQAKAQMIEYNQRTEVATLQIAIELKQKDSVCTSEFAVYRKKEQMLDMNGNPKIVRKEDVFQAREITFNLDTEEIILDGRVKGSVVDSGGNSSPAPSSPPAPDAGETGGEKTDAGETSPTPSTAPAPDNGGTTPAPSPSEEGKE